MIHRKFNNLKFRRTYIGGSKQDEIQLFLEVQGTKEDNSECNWLEYRRMLREYSDDKLNVLLSWRYLLNVLTLLFGGLTLLITFFNPYAGILFLLSSIGFNLIYRFLKRKEQKMLLAYDFSMDIINRETGLVLAKN